MLLDAAADRGQAVAARSQVRQPALFQEVKDRMDKFVRDFVRLERGGHRPRDAPVRDGEDGIRRHTVRVLSREGGVVGGACQALYLRPPGPGVRGRMQYLPGRGTLSTQSPGRRSVRHKG